MAFDIHLTLTRRMCFERLHLCIIFGLVREAMSYPDITNGTNVMWTKKKSLTCTTTNIPDKSKDTKTIKKHKFVNEIVLGGYCRLKKDNHIVLPTRAASVGDSVVYLES